MTPTRRPCHTGSRGPWPGATSPVTEPLLEMEAVGESEGLLVPWVCLTRTTPSEDSVPLCRPACLGRHAFSGCPA